MVNNQPGYDNIPCQSVILELMFFLFHIYFFIISCLNEAAFSVIVCTKRDQRKSRLYTVERAEKEKGDKLGESGMEDMWGRRKRD